MSKIINIANIPVTIIFNKYNKKTKKLKEIDMPITDIHIREILHQMDDTDMGEFYVFETDKIKTTGFFTF